MIWIFLCTTYLIDRTYLNFRGLADINGDGQMDINEFSVACKLITNKLKGVEIPKVLPPSMIPPTAMQGGMMPGMMQQPGMVRMNAAGKNY